MSQDPSPTLPPPAWKLMTACTLRPCLRAFLNSSMYALKSYCLGPCLSQIPHLQHPMPAQTAQRHPLPSCTIALRSNSYICCFSLHCFLRCNMPSPRKAGLSMQSLHIPFSSVSARKVGSVIQDGAELYSGCISLSASHIRKCTMAPISTSQAITQDRGPVCTRIGLTVEQLRHAIE